MTKMINIKFSGIEPALLFFAGKSKMDKDRNPKFQKLPSF